MKKIYSLIISILCTALCFAQNFPFPQNLPYTAGTIKPNHKTTQQLNAAVTTYYDAWKTKYIKNCSGKYYVDFTDEDPAQITTSESHGYGMMIMALIAGYDANAKTIFDGMVSYWQAHQSSITPNIMSWQQGSCSDATGNDDGATDGDLDVAYAFLLADAQWGSSGTINYLQKAKDVMNALLASEIHSSSYHTLLGDWASSAADLKLSRTSDFILDHFKAFQVASSNSKWTSVYEKTQSMITTLQGYNPTTGLLPDFVQNATTTPTIPTGKVLESTKDGWYSYNACRDPWRLGTDYLLYGDARSKTSTNKIINWLKGKSTVPANFVCETQCNGSGSAGGGEMCFIAPYMVGMMVDQAHQTVLNSTYDWVIGQSINSFTYFHNTIKMLCLLTVSGNYWYPDFATGINENIANNNIFEATIGQNENTATIFLNASKNTNANIMIYDQVGKLILSEKYSISNGYNTIPFSTLNFANGIYIVSISNDSEQKTIKFIK